MRGSLCTQMNGSQAKQRVMCQRDDSITAQVIGRRSYSPVSRLLYLKTGYGIRFDLYCSHIVLTCLKEVKC